MAQFGLNIHRFDPYKNFKFRVKWDGRHVAGVSKVSMLQCSNKVVDFRKENDPSRSRKSPGQTEYEAITLEHGITHDPDFKKWMNSPEFRKDIVIEFYNEAGQLAFAYKIFRCWVSEYQALLDLDAHANAVAIQYMKLENEGWDRDYEVMELA